MVFACRMRLACFAAILIAAAPARAEISLRGAIDFGCALATDASTAEPPEGFTQTDSETMSFPGGRERERVLLEGDAEAIEIVLDRAGSGPSRATVTLSRDERPDSLAMALAAENTCDVIEARRIERGGDGMAVAIALLDASLQETGERIELNPPVPEGTDPGGITVAHVDSGVNYLLPQISAALARDADGAILGHDFWDQDERPFDVDTGRSPFFPLHHGTSVASVLLAEAPAVRLVPLRYPRPDMTRMADVVKRAVTSGARIVMMPMGSNDPGLWQAFADAARNAPDTLFIVSAGNDGRDIDVDPLYPAVLDLPNMLVVTSADDFGRLAQGSNWGSESVDVMVPAERLTTTDHRGAQVQASGSSYAVPRVAASAARLLAQNPDWKAAELIARIGELCAPPMDRGEPRVKLGWIPDPANLP
ncbi:S8 family serine peptidase [Tepidamorphus sp. 3E244]|uniref:S8 family serine peptidase n=1 Tax=Tepidamorphus sp. 3E244 TaxID=3385498 RepID=UPI0038FCBB58